MRKRSDFIKKLHESEKYKQAMGIARSEEERQKIAAIAEKFVNSFAEVLAPIVDNVKKDPEFVHQLEKALNGMHGLVTTEQAKSGSTV